MGSSTNGGARMSEDSQGMATRTRISFPSMIVIVGVALLAAILIGLMLHQGVSAASHDVTIANFAFSPNSMTVSQGDTVTWTNNDAVSHTVTANDGTWTSPLLAPGTSYTHQFNATGDFSYHCSVHPSMTGVVHVGSTTTYSPPGGGVSSAVLAGLVILVALIVVVASVVIWMRSKSRGSD